MYTQGVESLKDNRVFIIPLILNRAFLIRNMHQISCHQSNCQKQLIGQKYLCAQILNCNPNKKAYTPTEKKPKI